MIIASGISLKFTEPVEEAVQQAKKILGEPVVSAKIIKRAVDARRKNDIRFVYSVALEVDGDEEKIAHGKKNVSVKPPFSGADEPLIKRKDGGSRPVIAGFGPAGIFAALRLSRLGLCPIILERGEGLDKRVKDVEGFFSDGRLNESSNVQFGEGGAGAFSDGKLTTRTHDPLCALVLNEFVNHGAPNEILIQAKPHIGTDLLRGIVKSIREEIISLGGEIRFNTRLEGLRISHGRLEAVKTGDGLEAAPLILAVGHSARDTFDMLEKSGVSLVPKSFSVGVRLEHLQSDVDKAMYGDFAGHPLLPSAEYVHSMRENGCAVYTFCMCPGGYVVAAASEAGGVVTNGMSEYARNAENANAALVVSVDASRFTGALDGVSFQRRLEQAAFLAGGGGFFAPAQDVKSFLDGKAGLTIGKVKPGYRPGVCGGDFAAIFPDEITDMLKRGILQFDRAQKGFADRQSILTGVETRTSSPVRIPRGESLEAVGVSGLYPCGEGAGYAGGIMSAAVDGWRVAGAVAENMS